MPTGWMQPLEALYLAPIKIGLSQSCVQRL